ncbi:pectate lyase-like [Hibiscus syriacus]|uniref:pectate lyase-like n=1 Tax=Hibiscus syriacus TaxID=106335 RepID=UPI001922B97F|nr:pectate lyase-like [Hibiscus syriacus]
MAVCSNNNFSVLGFVLSFVSIIPSPLAHIAKYDDYWRERELQAIENLDKAYNPRPEEVTNHYNEHAARTLIGFNSTRRDLREKLKRGPCMATNPIDQCWRCNQMWAENRKRLVDCALGFGRGTTGGKDGEFYVVTDPSDDDLINPKPGTLRHAVIQERPLWITFAHPIMIKLKEELIISTGDKTIDGRGARVHIAYGAGITIQYTTNIIIHNLHIHDIIPGKGGIIRDSESHFGLRTESDGDGISLFGASNVWLDHLSMYRCSDGIIDAIQGSTAITISNCNFTDHSDVMLFGGSDTSVLDHKMQITVALNIFGKGLVEKMPRCRFGFTHVVNNDYTHWLMYAIGGSSHPTIISQGNRYKATFNRLTKEVTARISAPPAVWKSWDWISEGDEFLNAAFFTPSGNPDAGKKFGADKMMPFQPGHQVPLLTVYSGALGCKAGKPC